MAQKVYNRDFTNEISYIASQSGGPGGQNVNKVNTKITLRFNIEESTLLSDDEKQKLREKAPNKINKSGILVIISESERTQLKNKEQARDKFYKLLKKIFTPRKIRKATKPSKASKQKRLQEKRIQAEKKELRQKIQ